MSEDYSFVVYIDNDEIEPRKAEISINLDILRIKFVAPLIMINRSRAALL